MAASVIFNLMHAHIYIYVYTQKLLAWMHILYRWYLVLKFTCEFFLISSLIFFKSFPSVKS